MNGETLQYLESEMMQFGRTMERVLPHVAKATPKFGPVYTYKIDLSDGFYRVPLTSSGSLRLGVCLPKLPNLGKLVAFSLVLPMGWTESPPFFSAFTVLLRGGGISFQKSLGIHGTTSSLVMFYTPKTAQCQSVLTIRLICPAQH